MKFKEYTQRDLLRYIGHAYKFTNAELEDIKTIFPENKVWRMSKAKMKTMVFAKIFAHFRHTRTDYEKMLNPDMSITDYLFTKQSVNRKVHKMMESAKR